MSGFEKKGEIQMPKITAIFIVAIALVYPAWAAEIRIDQKTLKKILENQDKLEEQNERLEKQIIELKKKLIPISF